MGEQLADRARGAVGFELNVVFFAARGRFEFVEYYL